MVQGGGSGGLGANTLPVVSGPVTRRGIFLALLVLVGGCGDDGAETAAPRPATRAAPAAPPTPEGFARFEDHGIGFDHPAGMEVETEVEGAVASAAATRADGLRFIVFTSPDVVSPEEAMALQRNNVAVAAVQRGERIVEDNQSPSRTLAGAEREGRRFVFETPDGPMHAELFAFVAGEQTVTVVMQFPDELAGREALLDRFGRSLRVAER